MSCEAKRNSFTHMQSAIPLFSFYDISEYMYINLSCVLEFWLTPNENSWYVQHSGIFHVTLGCWVLLTFGPQVCRGYGSFTFFLIYILGGISGNLSSFLHTPELTVGGTVSNVSSLSSLHSVFLFFLILPSLRFMSLTHSFTCFPYLYLVK